MFEDLTFRVFRLSAGRYRYGISCDGDGAFIGPVPLLKRSRPSGATQERWIARSEAQLNAALTRLYEMPIDVAAKIGGMETIARALNEGKLPLAKIAAVQLRFPDPPVRRKANGSPTDKVNLAAKLYSSALLKADDDWDEKHPRTGTEPNRGWFAQKPEQPKLPAKPGWPLPSVNQKVREWIARAAEEIVPKAGSLFLGAMPIVDAISAFLEAFKPTELNGGEERLDAQMRAYFDPPKTLEELQKPPTENIDGYERHHIVEQTDANIQKYLPEIGLRKFGRDKIEDPSNIAWIPRLKHEQISGDFSSKPGGPNTPTVREQLSKQDFATQREAGLEALRKRGVLK